MGVNEIPSYMWDVPHRYAWDMTQISPRIRILSLDLQPFFFCEVSSYMWFVTNSYVWMKCPVIYWRWLIDTCELWLEYLHESKYLHEPKFSRSSLLSVGDTTHLYVRHDSFLCETWLMHMCDMAHLNTKYDLNACTILLGCHASNIMYLCIYKWDIMHL